MTSETTYREQGRAVILAALMVLSVVAMSVAFAGSAAAAAPAVNTAPADQAVVDSEDATITANISGDDGDTVNVTNSSALVAM